MKKEGKCNSSSPDIAEYCSDGNMAIAENSAFYEETVPPELRIQMKENWLPNLK